MTDDPLETGTTLEGLFTEVRIALHSQGQNTWPYPSGPLATGSKCPQSRPDEASTATP